MGSRHVDDADISKKILVLVAESTSLREERANLKRRLDEIDTQLPNLAKKKLRLAVSLVENSHIELEELYTSSASAHDTPASRRKHRRHRSSRVSISSTDEPPNDPGSAIVIGDSPVALSVGDEDDDEDDDADTHADHHTAPSTNGDDPEHADHAAGNDDHVHAGGVVENEEHSSQETEVNEDGEAAESGEAAVNGDQSVGEAVVNGHGGAAAAAGEVVMANGHDHAKAGPGNAAANGRHPPSPQIKIEPGIDESDGTYVPQIVTRNRHSSIPSSQAGPIPASQTAAAVAAAAPPPPPPTPSSRPPPPLREGYTWDPENPILLIDERGDGHELRCPGCHGNSNRKEEMVRGLLGIKKHVQVHHAEDYKFNGLSTEEMVRLCTKRVIPRDLVPRVRVAKADEWVRPADEPFTIRLARIMAGRWKDGYELDER